MPCTLSAREKLAQTIRELEFENLMALESSSEEDPIPYGIIGRPIKVNRQVPNAPKGNPDTWWNC
ncbi:hypothetical protein BY996DRAFT_6444704 [Phakopsora pachyrhizi]|nr:hypothetical protein BY996DRAFT_6510046 [Phakopsora pachyrhizi]KAI8450255.1 hypothetical protein BY996DRAFT_6444704 [Phakopsora pachyrhizi]